MTGRREPLQVGHLAHYELRDTNVAVLPYEDFLHGHHLPAARSISRAVNRRVRSAAEVVEYLEAFLQVHSFTFFQLFSRF